jgi:molybdate transport system substrate-binding protein
MRSRIFSLSGAVITALTLWSAPVQADRLRVLATGVFEFAVRDLAESFKRQSGQDVSFTIVNAGAANAKLEAGETYDVILSSSASLDKLAAAGKVVTTSKVDVGRMRLAAGVKQGAPVPDLKTITALRAALLAAPAVAYIDPRGAGTSGVFFAKMFERLGIADAMHAKAVLGTTGEDVAEAVSEGRATLGMTQASELIGAQGVAFADYLPEDIQLITVYAAAVCASAVAPQTAEAFIRDVVGPVGSERLRKSGWEITPGR